MASLEEIRQSHLKKLELLKDAGIDPYPIESNQDFTLAEIIAGFSKLSKKRSLSVCGRVMALRPQGALAFLNVADGTGSFQALIKKDEIGEDVFKIFADTVDIGDFVELEGSLFITKRKEKTLAIKSWRMLSKSLRPLPEKWHGLQDVEERFRRRYLDALMSKEVKDRFILRSRLITEMRSFLDAAGYLEVETPALQPLYGGASAEPFITHHNALDIDLYLRISDELYLKRMLVAGFPKVYEVSKDFRNEGIDATHNPEFTMLEFYEAYSDSAKQMAFVEKMFKTLIKKLFKSQAIIWGEQKIDFSKKFAVISYLSLIKRHALIANPESISHRELKLKAAQLGVKIEEGDSFWKIMDNIYKKVCRPKLVQPTFIVDYPAEYLPLAKRQKKNPKLVDAFQLVVGGVELVKAFSELNDPIDQKERFMMQEKNKQAGEKDAQSFDEDFIEAMEYGMPPSGGVGIGIDRLMMLLSDQKNIKEVIFFPTMRPR
jgi:lysyl-tRNA synthetase class 2